MSGIDAHWNDTECVADCILCKINGKLDHIIGDAKDRYRLTKLISWTSEKILSGTLSVRDLWQLGDGEYKDGLHEPFYEAFNFKIVYDQGGNAFRVFNYNFEDAKCDEDVFAMRLNAWICLERSGICKDVNRVILRKLDWIYCFEKRLMDQLRNCGGD